MSEEVLEQSQETESQAVETPESELSLAEQLMSGQEESHEMESAAEPEEPRVPGIVDQLRELGFDNVTEEDAQQRLLQSYQQTQQQIAAMQQRQQELEQLAYYGQEYLQSQYQQPQYEQPQEDSWWNPPSVDTDLINKYRSGDGWKEGTPPDIRQAGDAYDAYVDKWIKDLAQRPNEVLPKIIQAELDRHLGSRLSEYEQERRNEAALRNIVETNSSWLYEKDARTGYPARNPDGSYVVTPAGAMALQHVQAASQMGIVDPQHQWNYALTALAAQRSAASRQPSPPAIEAPPRDPRVEYLHKAAQNAPKRSGSMETPEQPLNHSQNQNLSAGAKLLDQLRADGAPV